MYYFEDFQAGASFELGSQRVTEEEMIAFARLYDPQPFHISPEEAKASPFGGLIASGWQTVVILNRLFVESIFNHSIGLGSPGVDEVRWLKPVRLPFRCSLSRPVRLAGRIDNVKLLEEMRKQHKGTAYVIDGGKRPFSACEKRQTFPFQLAYQAG